ncbi:hypothetical protein SFR_3797 [Streptomyces sp. FR-008]|nr:hypothetical protein SFR_3797 [Streptomyces sp. FR-008]
MLVGAGPRRDRPGPAGHHEPGGTHDVRGTTGRTDEETKTWTQS